MSCLHTTTARSSTDIPGQRPRSIPSNDIDRDEAVPGTVRLVDVSGGTSDAHDKSQADIVLVPQPSADPNDPLNWTHARKLRTVNMAYLYVIGAACASLWSGNAADWLALRLARRNNGIREPEHRLWVLLLAGVMSSAGLITWGVGAHYSVHWVGLVFGLGVLTFGVVMGGSIAVSYNVDCFKEIAGETTVSVMLIRNTIGFGISHGITPWWTTQGLQNCFVTAAMISLACTFTFFLMIKYGKRIRRWSITAYKQFMATTVVAQE
ncbi:hypothetical protein MCOR04_000008 [Pyricularia oryzae]|nr:hypothetical protein MCOR04_000008 [Pyricularia oryzae]